MESLSPRELADRLFDYPKTRHALKDGNGYCCLGVYAHECELGTESSNQLIIDGCEAYLPNHIQPEWMSCMLAEVLTDESIQQHITNLATSTYKHGFLLGKISCEAYTVMDALMQVNDSTSDWTKVAELLSLIEKFLETGEKQ